jgi:phosphoesterase RecJ-like protein
MNNNLNEIVDLINNYDNIGIFPHTMPDGDAIGSSFALHSMLVKMGKNAKVVVEEDIPKIYNFLPGEYITFYDLPEKEIFDLVICVDSSDESRINKRIELFRCAKKTISIDHHITNTNFADINYTDTFAASTGEIIFELITLVKNNLTKEEAINLYVAIATDTGGFMYSNTTSKTHLIISKIFELDLDISVINRRLFDTSSKGKIILTKAVLNNLKFYENGLIALSVINYNIFKEFGLTYEDADGLTSIPRAIEGVEIGILITECEEKKIKISFRSNNYVNVSALALQLGGGGHERASGCTYEGEIGDAIEIVLKTAKEFLYES